MIGHALHDRWGGSSDVEQTFQIEMYLGRHSDETMRMSSWCVMLM